MIKGILMIGGDASFLTWDKFNFSALKGQTKASRKGLHFFSSRVTLVVSSMHDDFINYFLASLFKQSKVTVGGLTLVPEKVEKESIELVKEHDTFICLSPIILHKPILGNGESIRFINPESDEFSDKLYDITMQMLENIGGYSSEDMVRFNKFQLVPDSEYLEKLLANNKKYCRVFSVYDQDIKYEVRGYTFPFELYAEPEVKQQIFIHGLGELPHKGFGMIDLANQDPNSRTEEYPIPG